MHTKTESTLVFPYYQFLPSFFEGMRLIFLLYLPLISGWSASFAAFYPRFTTPTQKPSSPLFFTSPRCPSITSLHFVRDDRSGLTENETETETETEVEAEPPSNPSLSFFLSFLTSVIPVPLSSLAYSHFYSQDPVITQVLLVVTLLFISTPLGLINGSVAALSSITINSRQFRNSLLKLFSTVVPPSASNDIQSALEAFIQGLSKTGIPSLLSGTAGLGIDLSLTLLSPLFSLFFKSAARFVGRVSENSGYSDNKKDLGVAVVDTVLDAASEAIAELTGIASTIYGVAVFVVVAGYLLLDYVF